MLVRVKTLLPLYNLGTLQGPPYVFATMILVIYSVQPDDVSPNFIADPTGWMSRLSIETIFVPKFYSEGGQKRENVKLVTNKQTCDSIVKWGIFSLFSTLKLPQHTYVVKFCWNITYKNVILQLWVQKTVELFKLLLRILLQMFAYRKQPGDCLYFLTILVKCFKWNSMINNTSLESLITETLISGLKFVLALSGSCRKLE